MKNIYIKQRIIVIGIITLILLCDLLSKHFTNGVYQTVIPNILSIYSTKNTGGAWSIFSSYTWLLIVISLVFFVGIFIFDFKTRLTSKLYYISLSLVLGGGIGNMIDRLVLGHVRDFIQLNFINFPIFNIADMMLVVGVILLSIYFVFIYTKKVDEEAKK